MKTGVAHILGKNLKRMRSQRQMTQAALAAELGLSDVAIYNYEKGLQFPRSETIDALCDVLKVQPWQLLASDGQGPIPSELIENVAAAARACGLL